MKTHLKITKTLLFVFLFCSYCLFGQFSQEEEEMLALVNQKRAEAGVGPVVLNPNLNRAAYNHSKDMGDNNYFSHDGLNGSSFGERSQQAGYQGVPWGENIAAGKATPLETHTQWIISSGHLKNILKPNVNEMGIGHYVNSGSQYGHYWTQIFGIGSGVVISPPNANFSVSISCDTASFTDASTNTSTSYKWEFGDGTTSSLENPTHVYQSSGSYRVQLTVTNNDGTDTETKNLTIEIPILPSTQNQQICLGESALLTASNSVGYLWYEQAVGGDPVGSGTTLRIENVNENKTYYVAGTQYASTNTTTGMPTIDQASGTIHAGGYGLVFDAKVPFILKSVKMRAEGSGTRTIALQDTSGAIITTKNITVPDGENVVTLNLSIPQGNNLRLVIKESANLFRNNRNIKYPYSVPGVVTIKASTLTEDATNYYYYFYDWRILTEAGCETEERSQVRITTYATPELPVIYLDSNTNALKTEQSYSSYKWFLNNQVIAGANASSYLPITMGDYFLEITNNSGCLARSVAFTYNPSLSIQNLSIKKNLRIHPNPVRETLFIDGTSDLTTDLNFKIISINGSVLETFDSNSNKISVTHLKRGVYFLVINDLVVKKFIKD